MTITTAIKQLKHSLPQDSWTDDIGLIAPYLREWRDRWQGDTPFLVLPKSTQEVIDCVNICQQQQASLCLQGGNTGLVGGQIPKSEILLSTKNLVNQRQQTPETLTVEAGQTLTQIHSLAAKENKIFPLSLASEGSATIGGLCSTNAGGIHVVRYGSMRQLVSGLEVVLADGSIVNTLNPLKKDNTGYALTDNFIGAEGTLGVITAASLKLFPKPTHTNTLFVAISKPQKAIELYFTLKNTFPTELSAIELIPELAIAWVLKLTNQLSRPFKENHPWYLLIEFESFNLESNLKIEECFNSFLQRKVVLDVVMANSLRQAQQLRSIRESISASQKKIGQSIKHDISVPVEKVASFIQLASKAVIEYIPNCRPLAFGHIGDGNIHFNVMQPIELSASKYLSHWETMNIIVHDIVVSLGGSISAEHGIGILKKAELVSRYPNKVKHMLRLKNAFDPNNLFNPRLLF